MATLAGTAVIGDLVFPSSGPDALAAGADATVVAAMSGPATAAEEAAP